MSDSQVPSDGIYHPNALFLTAGLSPLYVAGVSVTSWLTTPGGLVENALQAFVNSLAYVGSAGAQSSVPKAGTIAALSAVYIAVTYGFTGAASIAAVAAGSPEGRNNKYPRLTEPGLRGLPLRLKSAHLNLLENFPGFALTAALAATTAPDNQQIINLLGLHVFVKLAVHYPCYVLNIDAPRTVAHILATSSVINVAWRLATNAV